MTENELLLTIEGRDAARSGRGRKLREAAGLSRSEVADLAGVSRPAISRWESQRRVPRGDNAVAYAHALRKIAEGLRGMADGRTLPERQRGRGERPRWKDAGG